MKIGTLVATHISVVVILTAVALAACSNQKPQATPSEATPSSVTAPVSPPAAPAPAAPALTATAAAPRTPSVPAWKAVTLQLIDEKIDFTHLPPDSSVTFTPIARTDDQPDQDTEDQLILLGTALQTWRPGMVADPVQRVRNLLYIPAAADIFQLPTESYIPAVVFAHLRQTVPQDDLIKVLYWIGVNPDTGDDKALGDLQALGFPGAPRADEARNRAKYYAVKLLGRLMDRINAQ